MIIKIKSRIRKVFNRGGVLSRGASVYVREGNKSSIVHLEIIM